MELDINTLRGLATVFCMTAFIGVVLWAYSDRKNKDFNEAANLPFEDEAQRPATTGSTATTMSSTNNNKEASHV